MARLEFLPQVIGDLRDIWSYIAAHNRPAADRLMVRFNARFELLAQRPLIGQLRPDIGDEVRHSVVARNYLILYRALSNGAQIVRVVHGSRDLSQLGLEDRAP